MGKAAQLEAKLTIEENGLENARVDLLRKSFDGLKKVMNPTISKIVEVKDKFEFLTALYNRI
jgi:hypothetical protein